MKFYKINKNGLKFTEMPQVQYKWNIPILVDNEMNVILGNSLKECLSDTVFFVVIDNYKREVLFEALREIELKIAEENDENRLNKIYTSVYNFFKEVRRPKVEYMELFEEIKEDRLVTEENYIEPPAYDFNKHGRIKPQFNDGCVLSEEFIEEVVRNNKELDFDVDMEILKELL